ncbi:hypothetical protein MASR1M45_22310 [Candidatus Kapaibacterium sp.]
MVVKMLKYFLVLISLSLTLYSQPKLEIVGGDTKNWGKVTPKQSPLKYNMVIKNAGNEVLKISRLKPTCGCTTAPLNKSELKPGETTTVEVSLSIQGNSGKMHKQIAIESNDPTKQYFNYMLIAEVVLPLTVSPTNYLPFKDLQVGVESDAKLKIKNTSEGNITLSDFQTNLPELKLNLVKNVVLKPGQEIDLIAKVKPTRSGNLNARISIKTTNNEIPELVINGFGQVQPSPFFNN